jgi:hypothetical protein
MPRKANAERRPLRDERAAAVRCRPARLTARNRADKLVVVERLLDLRPEVARPPERAWRTFAGSASALEANGSPSATASIVSATMIWFATCTPGRSPSDRYG